MNRVEMAKLNSAENLNETNNNNNDSYMLCEATKEVLPRPETMNEDSRWAEIYYTSTSIIW